jgi:hypothetical protein
MIPHEAPGVEIGEPGRARDLQFATAEVARTTAESSGSSSDPPSASSFTRIVA